MDRIAIAILFCIVESEASAAVPPVPNEAVVTGQVVGYSITQGSILQIQPDVPIYGLQVLVVSAEDVNGLRNMAKDSIGKVIQVRSKTKLDPDLFGKKVTGHVTWVGGDQFWSRGTIKIIGPTELPMPSSMNGTACVARGGYIANTLSGGCKAEEQVLGSVTGMKCPCVCCTNSGKKSGPVLDP